MSFPINVGSLDVWRFGLCWTSCMELFWGFFCWFVYLYKHKKHQSTQLRQLGECRNTVNLQKCCVD